MGMGADTKPPKQKVPSQQQGGGGGCRRLCGVTCGGEKAFMNFSFQLNQTKVTELRDAFLKGPASVCITSGLNPVQLHRHQSGTRRTHLRDVRT